MGADDVERKAQEQRLLRMAREHEKHEEEKLVTQSTTIGYPLMTADEVQAIVDEQERKKSKQERSKRSQDQSRTTNEKQDSRIIVEVHTHPMNTVDLKPKVFHVSAADRVAARKALLETFIATARTILTTNRVQVRLNKARVSLKGERQLSHSQREDFPAMSLFAFPDIPAMSQPQVLRLENKAASEPSKALSIDSFAPIEFKVPLYFKQMGYKPAALPEHPFVGADPPYEMELFPFGDNEPTENERMPLPKELIVEQLPQPTVSMTHEWPTQDFSFPKYIRTDLFPYDFKRQNPHAQNPYNVVLHDPLPRPLMRAQAEDALSDTDDEDAPDVKLEVRPPQSLQDVANAFPGLKDSFLLTAKDDAEAVRCVPSKPIHRFDADIRNALRVEDVDKAHEEIEACLPPPLRKQF
eukprot:GGOE01002568.1.p1 GENE.GGOE01002568.1~~GGOE01002568.1.p1  ORF type:complete len:411 (+),score=78.67 GGOE01002568.1:77-1309(+)